MKTSTTPAPAPTGIDPRDGTSVEDAIRRAGGRPFLSRTSQGRKHLAKLEEIYRAFPPADGAGQPDMASSATGRGYLIVIEGGDGSGKGTLIKDLGEYLQCQGVSVVFAKEPGGTAIGAQIRDIILSRDTPEMEPVTELLLFAASRAQNVSQHIKPALSRGDIVLADRFEASTVAYQHYGRELPLSLIKTLNGIATGGLKPDLTILLDLDQEDGMRRVEGRGAGLDRIEMADSAFRERVRKGFLDQAEENADDYTVIDAGAPYEDVLRTAIAAVNKALAR